MTIYCSKEEFATLVRSCYARNENGKLCETCILQPACAATGDDDPIVKLCVEE